MELGRHSIATRKIYGPCSNCGLDHTIFLVSSKLKLKWIHCYRMTLEKNDLGGMTPRKWLESIASKTSSLGSTLQLFGKKKKTIVVHIVMTRSFLEGRGNHPPSNYSCNISLDRLVYGHNYIWSSTSQSFIHVYILCILLHFVMYIQVDEAMTTTNVYSISFNMFMHFVTLL